MQLFFSGFQQGLGKACRVAGQAFEGVGRQLELNPYIEKLQPSLRSVKLNKAVPKIHGAFVAQSAAIVGNVTIGANSSIWYGAVLRGDDNTITIGENVTISDRVMVHCSRLPKEAPTIVKDRSIIQAGAILHGCTIEEGAIVGEGSQVLDLAKIGSNAVLAPGSILAQGKAIPAGQLWSGVPARYERDLSPLEIEGMQALVQENLELAVVHAKENAKTWQELEWEDFEHEQIHDRGPEYYRRLTPEQLSKSLGEVEGHDVPGRVLDSPISAQNPKY